MVIPCARIIRWRATARHGAPDPHASSRTRAGSHDDPEHGTATSFHAWRAAVTAGDRWRNGSANHARYWLPAHRNRKDLRSQVLPAGGAAHRPHRLSVPHDQQSLLCAGGREAFGAGDSSEGTMVEGSDE